MGIELKRRYLIIGICIFPLVIALWTKLWWLISWLIITELVFCALLLKRTFFVKLKVYYLLLFILVFITSIAIKVLLFEVYSIPSPSMENTLYSKDKILVSKLNYGPKMPNSPYEIPWINLFFYLTQDMLDWQHEPNWGAKRLVGINKAERQDVIVFNSPENTAEHFVKRCIALPGDTVLIKNGVIFINGQLTERPKKVKLIYTVWFNDRMDVLNIFDSLRQDRYPRSIQIWDKKLETPLNLRELSILYEVASVDSITIKSTTYDSVEIAFPWDVRFNWTTDNFGPLIIPQIGMKMILDQKTLVLYKQAILEHDCGNECLEKIETQIHFSGSTEYVFKGNYYFMMGDNRHNSNDSRIWGLVPENYIIGKAKVVLFSTSKRKTGGTRAFSKIE